MFNKFFFFRILPTNILLTIINMKKQKKEFIIMQKTANETHCNNCDGTGLIYRTFRKMKFVQNCPVCNGTGKKTNYVYTDVSLKHALKELNII